MEAIILPRRCQADRAQAEKARILAGFFLSSTLSHEVPSLRLGCCHAEARRRTTFPVFRLVAFFPAAKVKGDGHAGLT